MQTASQAVYETAAAERPLWLAQKPTGWADAVATVMTRMDQSTIPRNSIVTCRAQRGQRPPDPSSLPHRVRALVSHAGHEGSMARADSWREWLEFLRAAATYGGAASVDVGAR